MGKILECVNAVLAESRILALEPNGSHRWRFAMQNVTAAIERAAWLEQEMKRLQAKYELKQNTLQMARRWGRLFELMRAKGVVKSDDEIGTAVEMLIKRVDAIPCTCTVYDDRASVPKVAANVVEHPDDEYEEWDYSRKVSRCTRCVALGRVLDRTAE